MTGHIACSVPGAGCPFPLPRAQPLSRSSRSRHRQRRPGVCLCAATPATILRIAPQSLDFCASTPATIRVLRIAPQSLDFRICCAPETKCEPFRGLPLHPSSSGRKVRRGQRGKEQTRRWPDSNRRRACSLCNCDSIVKGDSIIFSYLRDSHFKTQHPLRPRVVWQGAGTLELTSAESPATAWSYKPKRVTALANTAAQSALPLVSAQLTRGPRHPGTMQD